MEQYSDFFIKFMTPFFGGIVDVIKNFFLGLFRMFNLFNYLDVVLESKLKGFGIFVLIFSIFFLLAMFGGLCFLIYRIVRRYIRYRKNYRKEEKLIEEIDNLNNDIYKLKMENAKIKELANNEGEVATDEEGNPLNALKAGESRFFKLSRLDKEFNGKNKKLIKSDFTLKELCENFRNYSASELKLYYDEKTIRLFISALASNKLIILEGISGTGKTSLAYALGKIVNNETTVASVQPSWRDSTEIFGFFNEFTKKFNETEILTKMYEALFTDKIYVTLLDEMNISRVEYYFAEMLSVLELPNKEEWKIELVPSVWENDPKALENGKIKVPANMWYIGTINNDDSTFMITDKVYDRAMPIAIDDRFKPFDAPATQKLEIGYEQLNSLFIKASEEHKVKNETLEKINQMERYVIDHFRLAFGNRIVKQIKDFIPTYIACGGEEIEGLDYIIAHKILRKFEQLNLAFVKPEVDGFIEFLETTFGKGKMEECKKYLLRLKKMI